mmetsp:Transcript_2900/g.8416  ORF Transcript_2900/g.8416 Transcript_2900/m.8416 type:complete len:1395 (-) Transcript_2900:686-4870(-)
MEIEYGCGGNLSCPLHHGMTPPLQPPRAPTASATDIGMGDATDRDPLLLDAESEVQEAALRRVHSELVRLCEELTNPPPHGRKRHRDQNENGANPDSCGNSSDGCGGSGGDGHSSCGYMSSGAEEDASLSGTSGTSNSAGSDAETYRAKRRCRELLPAIAEELERLQHAFRAFSLPPVRMTDYSERVAELAADSGGTSRAPLAAKKPKAAPVVSDEEPPPSTRTTPINPNLHEDGSWAATTSGAAATSLQNTEDGTPAGEAAGPVSDGGSPSDSVAGALPFTEPQMDAEDEEELAEPTPPLGALDKARVVKLLHERCARMRALADMPLPPQRGRRPVARRKTASSNSTGRSTPPHSTIGDSVQQPAVSINAVADVAPTDGSQTSIAVAVASSNGVPTIVRAPSLPASASTEAVDAASAAAAAEEAADAVIAAAAAGMHGHADGSTTVAAVVNGDGAEAALAGLNVAAAAAADAQRPPTDAPVRAARTSSATPTPGAALPAIAAAPRAHGPVGGILAAVSAALRLRRPVFATGTTNPQSEISQESAETATTDGISTPAVPTASTAAASHSPSSTPPSASAAAPPATAGGTAPGNADTNPSCTCASHTASGRLPRSSPINRTTLPDGRRALFMFCSPLIAPLDCNPEAKALIAAGLLRAAPPPLSGGSFSDLRQALREWRPHIFWFAGHGDSRMADGAGTLGFSGADGSLQLFSPAAIASELRQHVPLHGGCLECVVLNACSSGFELGSLGEMLYQVCIPCVVGWRTRAHNVASAVFSLGFGAALVAGKPYPAAFDAGVGAVTAQLEKARGQPGVMLQRYELIDPASERVVQPADVAAGRYPRRDLYRVHRGPGKGRLAAGIPDIKAHPPEMNSSSTVRGTGHGGPTATSDGSNVGVRASGSSSGSLSAAGAVAAGRKVDAAHSSTRRLLSAKRMAEIGVILAAIAAGSAHYLLTTAPPPQPQPLLRADYSSGKLRLEPSALAALRRAVDPVCSIGIAGPTEHGENTLANALMAAIRADTKNIVAATQASATIFAAPDETPPVDPTRVPLETSHYPTTEQGAPSITLWLSHASTEQTSGGITPTLERWAGDKPWLRPLAHFATAAASIVPSLGRRAQVNASYSPVHGCGSLLVLDGTGLGSTSGGGLHTGGPRDEGWLPRPTDSTLSTLSRDLSTSPLRPLRSSSHIHGLDDASLRVLAFLQLASSRLVLNHHRQPTVQVVHQMAAAARIASSLRQRATSAHSRYQTDGVLATSSSAGTDVGHTRLVLLVRDSHRTDGHAAAIPGASTSATWKDAPRNDVAEAVIDSWLHSAGERDASTIRDAFTDISIRRLPTARIVELGHSSSHLAFGAELAELTSSLIQDLPPLVPPTAAIATGSALAAWLEAVVRALNDVPL